MDFSLAMVSWDYSLATPCGFLIAGASLAVAHGLWGTQASAVVAHGLRGSISQALEHRLNSCVWA